MERISNLLPAVANTQELISSSKKELSSLTPEENKIVRNKYQSKRFCDMSSEEVAISSHALLVKIHVITGWVVPATEQLLDVLIDQFSKKLTETYGNVNVDEVEYAFRSYGAETKDWGKSVNLSLIDEVMRPFLNRRAEVSKMEEQKSIKALPSPAHDRDKTMTDWMEETRKDVCDGKVEWNFLPLSLYDFMIEKKLFLPSVEYKLKILGEAIEKRQAMIQPGTPEMSKFQRLKESGVFTNRNCEEEEAVVVRGICKKLTLFDYLWNL